MVNGPQLKGGVYKPSCFKGRLEIIKKTEYEWSAICDDGIDGKQNWEDDSGNPPIPHGMDLYSGHIACKQMGFADGVATSKMGVVNKGIFTPDPGYFKYDNLRCFDKSATDILNCAYYTINNCVADEQLGIDCSLTGVSKKGP